MLHFKVGGHPRPSIRSSLVESTQLGHKGSGKFQWEKLASPFMTSYMDSQFLMTRWRSSWSDIVELAIVNFF